MKNVIIIGAGGHSKVIADIIRKNGDFVYGFLDDADREGVIGKVSDCTNYKNMSFVIGIGNNEVRKKIAEQYPKLNYYTAIHPAAVIGENVNISEGTVIMANAVINPSSSVGKHCIINTGAIVEHDNVIADYVHLSPGAVLCGTVKVGECTHIGAGAVVRNNVTVTDKVVVGCGACVVKDLKEHGVYMGVPATKKE